MGGVEVFLTYHVFEIDLSLILTRCNEGRVERRGGSKQPIVS